MRYKKVIKKPRENKQKNGKKEEKTIQNIKIIKNTNKQTPQNKIKIETTQTPQLNYEQ